MFYSVMYVRMNVA